MYREICFYELPSFFSGLLDRPRFAGEHGFGQPESIGTMEGNFDWAGTYLQVTNI